MQFQDCMQLMNKWNSNSTEIYYVLIGSSGNGRSCIMLFVISFSPPLRLIVTDFPLFLCSIPLCIFPEVMSKGEFSCWWAAKEFIRSSPWDIVEEVFDLILDGRPDDIEARGPIVWWFGFGYRGWFELFSSDNLWK